MRCARRQQTSSQVITVTSFILPRKVEENFTEEVEFRLGASLQMTNLEIGETVVMARP